MLRKYFLILILFSLTCFGQPIEVPFVLSSSSFDVVTWNIEWFPKNGRETINDVRDIIMEIDADVYAIQEIDDVESFYEITEGLGSYKSILPARSEGGLGYIYDSATVEVNDIYEILTTSRYWRSLPRSPLVLNLTYDGSRIYILNNHLKCCGDGYLDMGDYNDEENRRWWACQYLKEYIDTALTDDNVIVLGDWNDELSDSRSNNVFQMIIDDSDNFHFTDTDIAYGDSDDWSYPTWPSHLDHILITNELFDEFELDDSSIQTIHAEDYLSGWWEYENNVSDHRPVKLSLGLSEFCVEVELTQQEIICNNYPNPFQSFTIFELPYHTSPLTIEITTLDGRMVLRKQIPLRKNSYKWQPHSQANGIYFARFLENGHIIGESKAIIGH